MTLVSEESPRYVVYPPGKRARSYRSFRSARAATERFFGELDHSIPRGIAVFRGAGANLKPFATFGAYGAITRWLFEVTTDSEEQ